MSIRTLLVAGSVALSAVAMNAATASYYIPASGSGAGANNSEWRSEVTFHNVASTPINVDIYLYTSEGYLGVTTVGLGPHDTVTASDLIKNQIARPESFGALEVRADSIAMKKLAVTSRAVNTSPAGEYGQDVPALRFDEAMVNGDTAVIVGPYHVADYRFNFGVFPIEATEVEWSVVRKDGTVAATKSVTYDALTQKQYNGGITSLLGVTPQDDDVVHATVKSGRAFFFGSIINNGTGDPSFVPAVRVRQNAAPTVTGIDVDENGTVDLRDADHDGRLDVALDVVAGSFPNFFRIIGSDEENSNLTFTLVDAPSDVKLIDNNGTVQWAAPSHLRGTTGTLVVRVSDGTDSTDLVIPVVFR
jgi:hypothetical protein